MKSIVASERLLHQNHELITDMYIHNLKLCNFIRSKIYTDNFSQENLDKKRHLKYTHNNC